MSNTVMRRNSSKHGLQNLMRLMAQRSIEDAEEVERERRQRAREASRMNGCSTTGEFLAENGTPAKDNRYDGDWKPSNFPNLEEDEGFGDWTHRRKQQLQNVQQGGQDVDEKVTRTTETTESLLASSTSSTCPQRPRKGEEKRSEGEAGRRGEGVSRSTEQGQRSQKRIEAKRTDADTWSREGTSQMKTSRATEEDTASTLEPKEGEAKIHRELQGEREQEVEELKTKQHQVWEEEEGQGDEEVQHQEDLRQPETERRTSVNLSSRNHQPFGPQTPTHNITDKTESLNHSLKKSNSVKKTTTLILVPKIDDKMEQYTHAVENSQDLRSVKAPLRDLCSSAEVVASRKNLFEVGDVWNQNSSKVVTCKDTDGLKVGVAELITQWVKGQSEGSSQSSCRVTDVKPGDVMQKKNLWEEIRDSSKQTGKASAASKKYKFVVTGHGKYEKMAVEDDLTKSGSCHS